MFAIITLLRSLNISATIKMTFDPDASKQAQEIIFSRKANASSHETVYFNNIPELRDNIQKHLRLFLDSKLSFFDHTKEKIEKDNKGVNVIRKMNLLLTRSSLPTAHLDYGHVIYDQPNNSHLSDKIDCVKYNAALAITGAITGISKDKLYQELGLESLKDRR